MTDQSLTSANESFIDANRSSIDTKRSSNELLIGCTYSRIRAILKSKETHHSAPNKECFNTLGCWFGGGSITKTVRHNLTVVHNTVPIQYVDDRYLILGSGKIVFFSTIDLLYVIITYKQLFSNGRRRSNIVLRPCFEIAHVSTLKRIQETTITDCECFLDMNTIPYDECLYDADGSSRTLDGHGIESDCDVVFVKTWMSRINGVKRMLVNQISLPNDLGAISLPNDLGTIILNYCFDARIVDAVTKKTVLLQNTIAAIQQQYNF
jgi:hypothetical protein